MSKTELQMEWERRIALYRASGQTQARWCEANDLKVHQLKYWLKKVKNTDTKPKSSTKWSPVTMEVSHQESNERLQINIGKTSIEVKPGFDPSFLADVVRTLKSI